MNEYDRGQSESPFDKSIFDNLRYLSGEEDQEMFVQLIAMFEAQLSSSLEKMRAARSVSDTKTLLAIAHALRGSSGNLGATRLADLCSRLELELRNASVAGADEYLSKIETEAGIIQTTLAAELARA
jgi:HPt (histidine-containing phosphotransfer) domain-containing protein